MKLIVSVILGYLIGAIPFALVIGKLFYRTDIRRHGSGNLGGGNAGRVLGKKAGLAVMTCDLLKVSIVVLFASLINGNDTVLACAAAAAGIGHCYPVFAGFRGGKAVAALYGFLFGLFAFAGRSPLYFFLPLIVFLIVLYLSKIISLSSILSSAAVSAYLWIRPESMAVRAAVTFFALLILFRHHANIGRMLRHEENKISWM